MMLSILTYSHSFTTDRLFIGTRLDCPRTFQPGTERIGIEASTVSVRCPYGVRTVSTASKLRRRAPPWPGFESESPSTPSTLSTPSTPSTPRRAQPGSAGLSDELMTS